MRGQHDLHLLQKLYVCTQFANRLNQRDIISNLFRGVCERVKLPVTRHMAGENYYHSYYLVSYIRETVNHLIPQIRISIMSDTKNGVCVCERARCEGAPSHVETLWREAG